MERGESTFDFVLKTLDLGIRVVDNFIHRGTEMAVPLGQVLGDMLLIGSRFEISGSTKVI